MEILSKNKTKENMKYIQHSVEEFVVFYIFTFLSKIFLIYIKKCSLIFSRISHFKHYFMVIGDIFYTVKPNTLF